MVEVLAKSETLALDKADTKNLTVEDTKMLEMSETRGKKMKHSYNVADAENALVLKLKDGEVVIEMFPDVAPNHVARIKELVRDGFYNGLKFHSGKKLKAEFNRVPHTRGVVSMARAMDPDSADSQFFICFDNAPHLDGQYTVWGKVVSGMEFVDNIKKGGGYNGMVYQPDEIISMKVISDM